MLDIKFIRENLSEVKKAIANRNAKVDLVRLLEVDDQRRKIIVEIDGLREKQNKLSKEAKGDKKAVVELREMKEGIKNLDAKKEEVEKEYNELLLKVPNMPDADVPVGKDENENQVIKNVGTPTKFDFTPKDHLEIGENLNLIDVKRAVNISGSRFCYLKNEVALLQMALIKYTWDLLLKKGFELIIPPVLSKIESVVRTGHPEALSDDAYRTTADGLALVGSSEHSIVSMHMDEILEEEELPRRYGGYSTCFRRESGAYGKDTKGIFRLHQFDKAEMVCLTTADESEKEFDFMLAIQEELVKGLCLPYRIVNVCTGDIGFAAAKQFDLEVWFPSQNKYRETHSLSNCRDFQTRRLNTKYKTKDGKKNFAHALNGTGFAIGRILATILENYQQKDGSVKVPKVLVNYCGFSEIKLK